MELNHGLSMTEQMRAELEERRLANKAAQRRKELRDAATTHTHAIPTSLGLRRLQVALLREQIAVLKGPFRRKASAALDVIVERAEGLIELALDLEMFEMHHLRLELRKFYGSQGSLGLSTVLPAEADTLRAAGDRLVEAFTEVRARVELEQLRSAGDENLNWYRRRAAHRAAAKRLASELALFLEALSEIPELATVELAADDILATQDAAAVEVADLDATSTS